MNAPEEFVPFEPVDHTADLAYIARGRTPEELFENAARGMMAFLMDVSTIERRVTDPVEAQGDDAEECLVALLQELIYRQEVHRRVYREIQVEEAGPPTMRALCTGEDLDPERHELHTEIKAATYHDLRIRREVGASGRLCFEVRIVLDI